VAIVAILLLAGLLLDRLVEVRRSAEHMLVEAEVANLRTELQFAVAGRIAHGEEGEVRAWGGRNPLELVSGEARNQQATTAVGGVSLSGPWRWDNGVGALVHEYRNGEHVQLRLARAGPGQANGWSLGAGLLLVVERAKKEQ
jgi:hypothetical protein